LLLLPGLLLQGQSKTRSSEIRAHLDRAEAALRQNDGATAERELEAVLALDPRDARANTNLGILALAKGDYRKACDDFRKALGAEPSSAKTEALLGICGRRLADPAATKHLERSFPKLEDPQLRTRVGMELIGIYYGQGDPERAVAVTQTLVELNPENPDILYTAQRLYTELAEATLNKLALVAPSSARMQQVIAEHLINAGDLPSAIEHYKKALEIDPRLPRLRYELAQAILETSRTDPQTQAAAIAMAEKAQEVDGKSSNVACFLARIALLQGDDAKAFEFYREAIGLDPGSVEAQVGLGRMLIAANKPEEAKKYLEQATESDPLNSIAHYRLAIADRRLGLEEEARKQTQLAREVKNAQESVERLYLQMNKQPKQKPNQQEAAQDAIQ